MRIVFLGTPAFAVPSLDALAARRARARRGRRAARSAGGARTGAARARDEGAGRARHGRPGAPAGEGPRRHARARSSRALRPDVLCVAAYGRILGKDLLELAPHGALNVHGSLLPKYRGAAPIQWAIASGEAETGVSIMQMDEGLDTGDVLLQRVLPIGPDDTAETLAPRLAALGGEALVEALALLPEGALVPVRQDETRATLAPILAKEDGRVDFAWTRAADPRPAPRRSRPGPARWTTLDGRTVKLLEAAARIRAASAPPERPARRSSCRARPRGALRRRDRAPRHRGCSPRGSAPQAALDFANGLRRRNFTFGT